MDGMHRNLTKRFNVYKKTKDGTIIHVTSLLANSLKDAYYEINKCKISKGGLAYIVTGITKNINEDISMNFPIHIQERIKNRGFKVKNNGYLYKYKNNLVANLAYICDKKH